MSTRREILVAPVALAGLIGFGATACRPNSDATVVGAVLPLTGDIASYGKAAQQGIDLAVSDINQAGGISGRPFQVLYQDSQGQTTSAIAALRRLTDVDHVPLVFGEAASSVTLALAPIAQASQVALITPISSSAELSGAGGDYFFRVCPSDLDQAKLMAKWIREDGHNRVGVIFVNNSWGSSLNREFGATFAGLGGIVVSAEGIREGDRDIRTPLAKLQALNPDALYAITYGREGGALLRQARDINFATPVYGADVWGSPELIDTAGAAATGVKIIVPEKFEGASYDAFAAAFRARYGADPDVYAAYAYDMTRIAANALAQAAKGPSLAAAIRRQRYDGVTGPTAFDARGDVVGKRFRHVVLPDRSAAQT